MTDRSSYESIKGIEKSGNMCVVCGWAKKGYNGNILVEGAHVHGFRDDPTLDKYDNIIALCPNHHTMFDSGVLTISVDGVVHTLDPSDECNNCRIVGRINHIRKGYIDYHNKVEYKGVL